jgi:hypothetical protein
MKTIIFAPIIITLGFVTVAYAEETQRYSLQRTDSGYVRTDTATGAISVCTEKGDQLVCRMAVDDLQAYEADIAVLEAKIDSLEKRVTSLETFGVSNPAVNPPAENEMEFQTSLNRMEQFFRRFMGIVKEFQAFGGDSAPTPDRT